MGTFTGRGLLSRVFGLSGIRRYFGPGSVVQEDFDPTTKTFQYAFCLDNIVLDCYVPEDEIHKRLEEKLSPHNFYKTAVPAGILLGAVAGPIGAALGGLIGAGVGYSLNAVNHVGFKLEKSQGASGEAIYMIKSPTIGGTLKHAAGQEGHAAKQVFRHFKNLAVDNSTPASATWADAAELFKVWKWSGAGLKTKLGNALTNLAYCGRQGISNTGAFIATQTGPTPDLPPQYMRGVKILRDDADSCKYDLMYQAVGAPKGQIVRDVNRIISTFTASEFGPRVRDYLSKKWDIFTYKLATATA